MVETASVPPRPLPVVTDDLALRFADTVDDPAGFPAYDHLGSYEQLLTWAVANGLIDERDDNRLRRRAHGNRAEADAALDRAHRLRAALLATLPVSDGFEQGYRALRPFIAEAAEHVEHHPTIEPHRTWPVGSRLDGMLWPIARAAEDLISGPDLASVKRCAGCEWVFVDRSRNGQRRWCDMDDCGRKEKIRRYVEKRRAARSAG